MATLALAAVGAAAGSALLPTGITMLGVTISGAAIGSQIGAMAGSYIDQALFGTSGRARTHEGPRLKDLHITSSTEGAPIPKLYGTARLGGQLIWAAPIRERTVTTTSDAGGGGGGKGGGTRQQSGTKTTEYLYEATFAVAICEGPISAIGRVWADGEELDLSRFSHRVHRGTQSQSPNSAILAREGASRTPAYRGLAYVVFEDMPLKEFGNRIPQLSFEVFRAVGSAADKVKGVVLIPGSGEFAYAPEAVTRVIKPGVSETENVHTLQGESDWAVALDQLETTLPACHSVSLVVSWFGTDLRASHCTLRPGVEIRDKSTTPHDWSVAGVTRGNAYLVSERNGRPAYGGTPSDRTVVDAIRDLKSRGFDVILNPFILMDVPEDSGLADPYGASEQAAYPWRGRITVAPAPGRPGTPDKTSAAASQIASLVGTAARSDFSIDGRTVLYSGPNEWSLRRMVLHYAHLAKAAGGVDAFLIGSELRGLTQVRSGASTYPFVSALVELANDVKRVLGSATKVTYAADWSEYFGHQPADGSGDVYFHLDPLWASPDIDAIGIDAYWPLADWRDGPSHRDAAAGFRSTYDLAYLRSNLAGGEGFDWYYESPAARAAQLRTPITDGAVGKPWVFRYKDIKSWWLNQHFNRPGGNESASPTAWVPQSKPFWLMEIGCPAVDKGANQPNVFVDPKSAESALPYFSRGERDDLMQQRYIEALIDGFDPASADYVDGLNPVSALTGKRMVDMSRIHVYAWDARPFPAFPQKLDVWSDGENWRLGHWLNGRMGAAALSELVATILTESGFDDFDVSGLTGIVPGFVIDRIMSPRDALEPLELAFFFDAHESDGRIVMRHRGANAPVVTLSEDELVEERKGDPLLTLTRAQETELPASAKVHFIASAGDYRKAVADARRLSGRSGRISQAELPLVLDFEQAAGIAESWLFEAWAARERAVLKLPPSALAIEPGDLMSIERGGEARLYRVTEIGDRGVREVEARAIDPEVYGGVATRPREPQATDATVVGQPLIELLDLPLLRGDEPPDLGYLAAFQQPWSGGVALYASPETTGYVLRAVAPAPAVMGTTLDPLAAGPPSILNKGGRVRVELLSGELGSVTALQMLSGRNAAALHHPGRGWEVIQFETATLVAPATYELAGLLRGQAGTEDMISASLAAGARFVLLGAEIERVSLAPHEVRLPLNWRYGPASRDIGDASYATTVHAFGGRARLPLSPVHIRGRRSNGNLTISWVRRTRIGGDSWDVSEVPLAEEREAYEVDILDGTDVKRTLSSTTPSLVYGVADQITDFGAPQQSLSVVVYQVGSPLGRGIGRAAII